MTPDLKAFLDLIAWSEGTSTSSITQNNGYDVIVSGVHGPSIFTDYADHPFAKHGSVLVRVGPPVLISTAAGRYQVLAHYWNDYKRMLQLPDFSPPSQDAVALRQMSERYVRSIIDPAKAIAAVSNIWASFPGPGNKYGQRIHPLATLLTKYNEFITPVSQS